MIPLQLDIVNFLSYRQQATLNYQGIHLACIAGANGAGKSTLLEAMTWALFGKSRSRNEDDIVNRSAARLGESAEARFTFQLDGVVYRIIRRKKAGGRGQLEFQMALNAQRRDWKTLSEGRLRDTQNAIENTLKMNYDTFINASFFLQGKADEFTLKSADQRKEILADLLGVTRWDDYKAIASERRKETKQALALCDAQLHEIEVELGQAEVRALQLAEENRRLQAAIARRDDQEKLLRELQRRADAIHAQTEQVKALAAALERDQRKRADLETLRGRRQQEVATLQALVEAEATLTARYVAWQALETELQAWQTKADAWNALQRARQKHEIALAQAQSRLTAQLAALQQQAQQVAAMRQEQEQVNAALTQAQAQLAQLQGERETLSAQEEAYQAARAEYQHIKLQLQHLARQLEEWQQKAAQLDQLRQEQQATQAALDGLKPTRLRLEAQVDELATARRQQVEQTAGQNALKTAQEARQAQLAKVQDRFTRLQAESSQTCPLCGQLLTQEHRQQVLQELEEERAALQRQQQADQQQGQTMREQLARLAQRIQQLTPAEKELSHLQQHEARLLARRDELQRALDEGEAAGYAQTIVLLTQQQAADEAALRAVHQRGLDLAVAVGRKNEVEKAWQRAQAAAAHAQARLAEIHRAIAEWEQQGAAQLATVAQQLEQQAFAPEARAALARLTEEATALDYDVAAHQAVQQQRRALADAPQRYQELQRAQGALHSRQEGLADVARQLEEQINQIAEAQRAHDNAVAILAALQADAGDVRAVETALFRVREEVITLSQRVGAAQRNVDVLDEQRARRTQLQAERGELALRLERLERLERACGRDGVQHLLIEHATPEIEASANELLERLTGGQMRVTFETQRKLKTRDEMVDTLDIHIQDESGNRPYENYSGGEQFRINFAIRLALSKILARRAGARLQTLVIDEGFGSQDPAGRQRLIEAIHTIQNDFECILVITHIDELRDAFPTRIEVTKTAAGSQLVVQ